MEGNRNAPCPCGSSKKFKNCCSPLHQERARWDGLEDKLRKRINNFFDSKRFLEDYRNAIYDYGVEIKDLKDLSERRMFSDWFIHDYLIPGENESIIKIFLRESGTQLDNFERVTVKSWSESVLSFYEVLEIKRSSGFKAKDIFNGDEHFVFEVSGSETLAKYDIILARLYKIGNIVRMSGGGKILPHRMGNHVKDFVENGIKSAGMDDNINGYLKDNSLAILKFINTLFFTPTIVTAEGDIIVFSKARYKVNNAKKASKVLRSSNDFIYLGIERKAQRFDWINGSDEESYQISPPIPNSIAFTTHLNKVDEAKELESFKVLGNLSLRTGSLVIECMSEQRLQRCKKKIEDLFSGLVEHVRDEYDEPRMDAAEQTPSVDDDLLPGEVEAVSKYFDSYYKKWLETRIPYFGNLTPLEASKTDEGRGLLDEYLKDMENMRERNKSGKDDPVYPVERLRKKLGLER